MAGNKRKGFDVISVRTIEFKKYAQDNVPGKKRFMGT